MNPTLIHPPSSSCFIPQNTCPRAYRVNVMRTPRLGAESKQDLTLTSHWSDVAPLGGLISGGYGTGSRVSPAPRLAAL